MNALIEDLELNHLVMASTLTLTLVLVVSVTYLIWPQYQNYTDIQQTHDTLTRMIGDDKTIEQNIEERQQTLNSLRQKLHGKVGGLTTSRIESSVIRALYDISNRTNTALLSVEPRKRKSLGMFEETRFEIELRSNYRNFYKWVATLQNELGFVVINQYELSTSENPTSGLPISLTLSAFTPRP